MVISDDVVPTNLYMLLIMFHKLKNIVMHCMEIYQETRPHDQPCIITY